jgi:hypothetical protein
MGQPILDREEREIAAPIYSHIDVRARLHVGTFPMKGNIRVIIDTVIACSTLWKGWMTRS